MEHKKPSIEHFLDRVETNPDQPFLRQPFGDTWEVYTVGQVADMAKRLATGLQSLGLRDKAHIGLISKNCREWIIADIAITIAGYISVPFFATLSGEQLGTVLELGDVDALFVGKIEQWDDVKDHIPESMPMIAFPPYKGNSTVDRGHQWHEFIEAHEPLKERPTINPKDLWTIIFTSGTTGTPKGVMLDHQSTGELLWATKDHNPLEISDKGDNHFFSFLPLNHIAERSIVEGAALAYGGQISFAETLDTFAKNLQDTQPTVFFAVPRLWTKFHLAILDKMPQKKLNRLMKIPIISGVVKKKIKNNLGLTNSRCNVSGAAPISQTLKDWYKSVGIEISEGYGMTENSAACTFLKAHENRPKSVGKAAGGVEMKIDPDTNEILMKAPFVMLGYYKSPELTEKVLKDGWLHTGDEGKIDKDGYLFITGRVKDTFKTAKGEFITPAPIELEFGDISEIEQICVMGRGLSQPIALAVLSEIGQAADKGEVESTLTSAIDKVNEKLPGYTRLSTMVITKEPFTVENGMLTPTMKIKRSSMNEKYGDRFEEWCEYADTTVWES